MKTTKNKLIINIIGGGLAGVEASFYLANHGYQVHLYEMRPKVRTKAHHTDLLGELVCSNSLKSNELSNACGLLKEELRQLNSLIMTTSAKTRVKAGAALSVSREDFAKEITKTIQNHPNIKIINDEVSKIDPNSYTIIATGPLTSEALIKELTSYLGVSSLSFFDASSPIITKESINMNICYYKSRYDRGSKDYINCPFTKEEYQTFYQELINATRALVHEFDTTYFEGCLPVEVMAKRGIDTLRYGPLKPRGLRKDENHRPYAVLQLRQDDALDSLYSLVGFQTNLTYPEQKRVFSLIPGLEQAEFVRLGLMHRNTYFHLAPLINEDYSLKALPKTYLAGQLSGVEGYVESAASGLAMAIYLDQRIKGNKNYFFPKETILGALLAYLKECQTHFTPMNAMWSLTTAKKDQRLAFGENSIKIIKAYHERN